MDHDKEIGEAVDIAGFTGSESGVSCGGAARAAGSVEGEVAAEVEGGSEGVDGRIESNESTSSRSVCVFRAAHG